MNGSLDAARLTARLVQDHGLAQAKVTALEETIKAQRAKDYYQLSVWREVRRFLDAQDPNA